MAKDPLFYRHNRERFAAALPDRTAALFFSGEGKHMCLDTDYRFMSDLNFFYMTGLEYPGYVLVIEKDGDDIRNTIYAPARDSMKERWKGKRLDFDVIASIAGLSADEILDLEKYEEREFELIKDTDIKIYLDNSSVMAKPFELKKIGRAHV